MIKLQVYGYDGGPEIGGREDASPFHGQEFRDDQISPAFQEALQIYTGPGGLSLHVVVMDNEENVILELSPTGQTRGFNPYHPCPGAAPSPVSLVPTEPLPPLAFINVTPKPPHTINYHCSSCEDTGYLPTGGDALDFCDCDLGAETEREAIKAISSADPSFPIR